MSKLEFTHPALSTDLVQENYMTKDFSVTGENTITGELGYKRTTHLRSYPEGLLLSSVFGKGKGKCKCPF